MQSPEPIRPCPEGAEGTPALRVVALDAERRARLVRALEGLGAEVRAEGGDADAGPVDAVLVAVEGLEGVAPQLPGRELHLVALDPKTPATLGGRPVIPAHAPGALEAWLELLRERARGERRAGELERGLRALLELDRDGLAVVDDAGRALVANEAARELASAAPGSPLPLALPPEGTHRVVTLDGQPVAIEVSACPWGGSGARLVRLRAATGREGFEGRLAHAERLVAVGALAAGFAHEVNNPAQSLSADLSELTEQILALDRGLGAARGRLSDAEREAFDALGLHRALAEARDLLQECFAGLDRISGLVRDLKSFSRLQPERVEWVHPNEVVNQACAIAHNHIRHKARLVKELTALDAFVGDRNKLVQVITNLLVNASQALPEDARDAQVLVRSRAEADRVIISVVDTGPGIPPDVLGRIFEPFYTTKLDTDGTGLGLALSLDIARQHGGTLEVETVQGQGTRFDLVLPRRNGLEVPEAVEAPTRDVRRRGQVWVVDDEPGIRRSLGRLIGRSHDVETFADAAAVLERIDAGGACDVLLCDLMMPEMDGPALYDALLARAPETAGRMVFMSGGAFTERASGFLERVGSQVVDKPAPAAVLEEVIQSALARPEETSEIPG